MLPRTDTEMVELRFISAPPRWRRRPRSCFYPGLLDVSTDLTLISTHFNSHVDDFELDSLAYYHRGLNGEQHERLGAG